MHFCFGDSRLLGVIVVKAVFCHSQFAVTVNLQLLGVHDNHLGRAPIVNIQCFNVTPCGRRAGLGFQDIWGLCVRRCARFVCSEICRIDWFMNKRIVMSHIHQCLN